MGAPPKRISLIIGTAGHVDHGKTSLIRALTSIDTDRLVEEKRRGLTIDLGFAYMDFNDNGRLYRAAIVDVPGHERFIRNMLAGVTGMDLVLFTIAADDGIMPQTREHLDIIRLLGIKDVFFVITKCDLAGSGAMEVLESEIRELIRDTPLSGAPLFRVSVKTGLGLADLTEAMRKKVLAMKVRPQGAGYFRLPVDRSFTIKGFGTVVTGTVAGGTLRKGGTAAVFPTGRTVKARGMESMHMAVESVSQGERAAVNLSGLARTELRRGACLMAVQLLPYIKMPPVVDCEFEFIGKKTANKKGVSAVRNRGLIKVHHYTGEALARIRFAGEYPAAPGVRIPGRLFLRRPLLMMRGDAFILRDSALNTTVGGGRVVFSYPKRGLVPPFKRLASLARGGPGSGGDLDAPAALSMLLGPLRPGMDIKTLSLLFNIREEHAEVFLREEVFFAGKEFYLKDGFLISRRYADEVKDEMMAILRRRHKERPLEEGLAALDLAGLYGAKIKNRETIEDLGPLYISIIRDMAAGGLIEARGSRFCLPGHSPAASGPESAREKKIQALIDARGLAITKREEIDLPGVPARDIEGLLTHMKKKGSIAALGRGAFISGKVIHKARKECVACINAEGTVTAARFRDILGCGRKLAILILEHFDTEGLTLRRGDERTLR